MSKIFLVSKSNIWSDRLYDILKKDFDCEYFNTNAYEDVLSEYSPDWIFFFHWSEMISEEIYNKYKCVVIHTGNLPKGRGGSPLQNQILEGIIESKVNAISVEKNVDSGDIYCSLPITLQGSITDVWLVIVDRACTLIKKCVNENLIPDKQIGYAQVYKRNKNNKIPLESADDIIDVHKFIQMLDDKTYPNAFFEIGNFRLEFSRSKLDKDCILSDVVIRRKHENISFSSSSR